MFGLDHDGSILGRCRRHVERADRRRKGAERQEVRCDFVKNRRQRRRGHHAHALARDRHTSAPAERS